MSQLDSETQQMVADLEGWAHVLSPKRKKDERKWIAAVGRQAEVVQNAEAKGVVTCGPDECLVLMDTGCGKHTANPKKHFLDYPTRESEGQRQGQVFVTADETEMPNLGEKVVPFTTMEGNHAQTTFQMTNVAMPIMSIRQLGKTHRTMFADKHRNHGYIQHRVSGQKSEFFSQDGVYFMKIKLRPPADAIASPNTSSGFVRPA